MNGEYEKDLIERERKRQRKRVQTELSSSFSSWQYIPSGYEKATEEKNTETHRH